MISLDKSLVGLVRSGVITIDAAMAYSKDSKNFQDLV
jgi:Tfp pilus assembly pilus retraction ATPase PilT